MEIDLNLSYLSEVENNVCGKGDECVKGCVNCYLSTSTSSCSSNAASNSSSPCSVFSSLSICMELWHACAGPLTSLPKKGDVVVYFAQGHIEQAASASPIPLMESPAFDLPRQIFCRVVDVQLLANKENDEVYSQLTLLPLPELVSLELEGTENGNEGVDDDGNVAGAVKSTSHMFCKTLTASDTSTHGGFSVPRRAAEDCFPPLDYKEQRPSQELIAKDLHGVEWKFRHIYRGQPRRHLLTSGWSIFVSQKNLASGDAVLFLRGESGDLRLGIRRAARPRNGLPDSIIKSQNSYTNVLSPVAYALSTNTTFNVFYSPRASHADFIVPYQKYVKSTTNQIYVGTRFKMKFESDDSPERRFSGVVIGVGDMDPYRWPNSKWRSLMVRWDDDIVSNHQDRVSPWDIDRVSPWDIDFSGNFSPLSIRSSLRIKKLRSSLQATPPLGSPIFGGSSSLDFEESVKFSKVLQGQENVALVAPLYKNNRISRQLDFETRPPATNPILDRMDKINHPIFLRNSAPTTFTSFLQSNWLPEVLQGQEIRSLRSLSGKTNVNLSVGSKPELGCNVLNAYQLSFYPLASEGARSMSFSEKGDVGRIPYLGNELRAVEQTSPPPASMMHLKNLNDDNYLKDKVPTCKLFGFSLTDDLDAVNSQGPSKRSCTKVHKQGSLVSRAIDLSKLLGYEDLLTELERLFGMEGLLRDSNNGWHLLYTDSENDMMVVGDDPWNEFVDVVAKIHIYTQEEVDKLSIGINSDDTQSCLEEAPRVTAVSKASSVARPDSSPTVVRM